MRKRHATLDNFVTVACSSTSIPLSLQQEDSSDTPVLAISKGGSSSSTGKPDGSFKSSRRGKTSKSQQKKNGPKLSSHIWNYFVVISERNISKQPPDVQQACKTMKQPVVCSKCHSVYEKGSGTKVLGRHLSKEHNIRKESHEATTNNPRQTTLEECREKVTLYSTEKNAPHFNKFVEFVVGDLEPLRLCESVRLRRFVTGLNPKYSHPGRSQVRDAISTLAAKNRLELQGTFSSIDDIHITTDLWTSGANKPFLGVTFHWVDPTSFRMDWIEAKTKMLPYPHTAADIRDAIRSILEAEGIADKVRFVTTDNGSNMVNSFEDAPEFTHIRCAAHSLQLVVNVGINDAATEQAVGKVKELIAILARPKQAQFLRAAQILCGVRKADTLAVVKPVDTR
jgi:hypothetical protein